MKHYNVRIYYHTFVDVEVSTNETDPGSIEDLAFEEIEKNGADFFENMVQDETDVDITELSINK